MSSVGIHGRTSTAPTAQEQVGGTVQEEAGCSTLGEVDGTIWEKDGWHLRGIPEIYTLKIDEWKGALFC